MSIFWSSPLLWLIIPISLLPDCCNGVRNIPGNAEPAGLAQILPVGLKQAIKFAHHQQGESSNASGPVHSIGIEAESEDNQLLTKIEHQIIEEVREKYKAINQYEDINEIRLMGNVDKSTKEAINFFEQMAEQNVKDESSMKEVIEIFKHMSKMNKWQLLVYRFKCALIAKIAFNRFMEIFMEARAQEIAHEKRVATQHRTLERLKSFHHDTSFKENCAYKILTIFALANIRENDLQKRVKNTIVIVENAVKFYEMQNEQKYQGMEDLMANNRKQMEILKIWLEKMQKFKVEYGKNRNVSDKLIADDIFEALIKNESLFITLDEAIKKGPYTILKESDIMRNSQSAEVREENLKILIIFNDINPSIVELKEIVEKGHRETAEDINDGHKIMYKISEQFSAANIVARNAALNEADFPVIEKIALYFEQIPYEWRTMLARIIEYALIAKITFDRFLRVYDEYVDLEKKKASEEQLKTDLAKIILLIFAFFQPQTSDYENLEDQWFLAIKNLGKAIKFYEILGKIYNLKIDGINLEIERIKQQQMFERSKMKYGWNLKKEMKKERKTEKERNKMEKEKDQMVNFRTWLLEKVGKIVEPGNKTDEEMLKIGKKILKSLIATIREFDFDEAKNAKRLKHHFVEIADEEATKIEGDDESAGNSHQHQHDHHHHLMEHAHQQKKNDDGDDKGKQPAE